MKNLTAIGDTVNVASRLETIAKELDATVVVSEPTILLAGSDTANLESQEIAIRGRAEPLRVYIIHISQETSSQVRMSTIAGSANAGKTAQPPRRTVFRHTLRA